MTEKIVEIIAVVAIVALFSAPSIIDSLKNKK